MAMASIAMLARLEHARRLSACSKDSWSPALYSLIQLRVPTVITGYSLADWDCGGGVLVGVDSGWIIPNEWFITRVITSISSDDYGITGG